MVLLKLDDLTINTQELEAQEDFSAELRTYLHGLIDKVLAKPIYNEKRAIKIQKRVIRSLMRKSADKAQANGAKRSLTEDQLRILSTMTGEKLSKLSVDQLQKAWIACGMRAGSKGWTDEEGLKGRFTKAQETYKSEIAALPKPAKAKK